MKHQILSTITLILAAPVFLLVQARATGGTFQGLGTLPGGAWSAAYGLSPDGTVIVGGTGGVCSREAFRWTAAEGMAGLGQLAAGEESYAWSASPGGSFIVGYSELPWAEPLPLAAPHPSQAFRWSPSGGMQGLGYLPGNIASTSRAYAVSAGGTVVAGEGYETSGVLAMRWTETSGMQALGLLTGAAESSARGVSADGSVVVGWAYTYSGDPLKGETFRQAFRWTQEGAMIGLGYLPGRDASSAYAVSADGSMVVGVSYRFLNTLSLEVDNFQEAFVWTEADGMVGLGDLPGGRAYSAAYGVSGDGRVIVGQAESAAGLEAFVWTPSQGMRSLWDILLAEGVTAMEGWTLTTASAVSQDGRTIVGSGMSPEGNTEAWVATIPEPSSLSLLALNALGLLTVRRFKTRAGLRVQGKHKESN